MTRISIPRDRLMAEDILSRVAEGAFLGFLDTDPTVAQLNAMQKPEGGKGVSWYNTTDNLLKGYDGTTIRDQLDTNKLQQITVDAPVAADDYKCLFYDHTNAKFDYLSPGGGITLFPWFRDSVGQGTWGDYKSANYGFAAICQNDSNTDGDNYSFKYFLAAGTYTIKVIGIRNTNQGITSIDIDGVEVASFDMYGALIYTHIPTPDTGNIISTSGVKDIRVRVDGKNASSTGYYSSMSALNLYRMV